MATPPLLSGANESGMVPKALVSVAIPLLPQRPIPLVSNLITKTLLFVKVGSLFGVVIIRLSNYNVVERVSPVINTFPLLSALISLMWKFSFVPVFLIAQI